jgi:hypothetical protein
LIGRGKRPGSDDFTAGRVAVGKTARNGHNATQGFPETVRQALPLDVATATTSDDGFVLKSALTDIGLTAQPNASAGSIHGKEAVPSDHAGVLAGPSQGEDAFSTVTRPALAACRSAKRQRRFHDRRRPPRLLALTKVANRLAEQTRHRRRVRRAAPGS